MQLWTFQNYFEKHLKIALFAFDLWILLLNFMLFASGFRLIMNKISFGSQKNQIKPKLDKKMKISEEIPCRATLRH